MKKYLIIGIILSVHMMSLDAQDLSAVGKANPLSINGSISINQIAYGAIGIDSRRDPYSFFASGGLTFNLYGWSVPVNFTYSNQEASFSQPFNQYSLSPTYKNYTGHFGYTSMTFSPYTLSGHVFLGAGVEASFEKWRTGGMYGRLRKEVEPTAEAPERAVYRRMGYGGQAVFSHKGTTLDFSFFRGKDDAGSITFDQVDSVTVTPEENLVMSIGGTRQLFKKISLSINYALSAITADTRFGFQSLESNRFYNNLGGFFIVNGSTSFYDAVKVGTSYAGQGYTVGFGYERVDPGYTSHGAYYFVNDLENITINGSKVLLGGRMNLNASGGVQRDNLNGEKISTMERFVGDVSVGYTPSSRLNLTTSYSNFQTFTNIQSQFVNINELTPFDNLDTLDFRQISQSISASGNYMISSSETRRQNAGLNVTLQDAKDTQGEAEQSSGNLFYLISGSYSVNYVPQKINGAISFNYNRSTTADLMTETLGPSVSFGKSLKENKMNISAGLSWNQSRTGGVSQGSVASLRLGGRYLWKEKHNFNLNLTTVNRSVPGTETSSASDFTEITATLGYSYSFSKSNFFTNQSKETATP
ncbi:MAG: hypothetical protein AAGA66_05430 [Bacteroidota bacterium]